MDWLQASTCTSVKNVSPGWATVTLRDGVWPYLSSLTCLLHGPFPISVSLLQGYGLRQQIATNPVVSGGYSLLSSAIELCDPVLSWWVPVRALAGLTHSSCLSCIWRSLAPWLGLLPASGQPCPLICFSPLQTLSPLLLMTSGMILVQLH